MSVFTNPIVTSGADPWVIRWEKQYHYCFSRNDRVYVSRAGSLVDIGRGTEAAVWTPPPQAPSSITRRPRGRSFVEKRFQSLLTFLRQSRRGAGFGRFFERTHLMRETLQ